MSDQIKKGTVLSALMWASNELRGAGIETYRLDAELLLSDVLKLNRVQLYMNFDRPMNQDEKERFFSLVKRRIKREPIAYILNYKEFMSLKFFVDRNVLIPRPETECLVEWLIKNAGLKSETKVLDLGTGSGCIAASLLNNTQIEGIYISDISEGALEVARKNMSLLCSNKKFQIIRSSLFERIDEGYFDLIVSNPPYIRKGLFASLMPEITEFEPRIALDGGENGDDIILKLIDEAYNHLKTGGILIFEHSEDFSPDINLIKDRYEYLYHGKDYSGRERFSVLKRL